MTTMPFTTLSGALGPHAPRTTAKAKNRARTARRCNSRRAGRKEARRWAACAMRPQMAISGTARVLWLYRKAAGSPRRSEIDPGGRGKPSPVLGNRLEADGKRGGQSACITCQHLAFPGVSP
ncbi:MAG: hypothetical protein AMXMBFR34_01880 [Myxococcaceae bacterium]